MIRDAFWGFFFGTVGLYVLAMLSMVSSITETLVAPLMWPGRLLASLIANPDATSLEVSVLTLGNGIFYAIVFIFVKGAYRPPSGS